MTCKQRDTEREAFAGLDLFGNRRGTLLSEPKKVTTSPKEVDDALDKKASEDDVGTLQDWRQEEKKEVLKFSDRATAIGKKKIIINTSSFGPPLKYRKNNLGVLPDSAKLEDKFRLTSGKYWTIAEDNETITYLNNPENSPYSVLDWNFTGREDPDVKDLIVNEDFVNFESDIDVLVKDAGALEKRSLENEKVFFGTQQWVLIKANKMFYSKPDLDIGRPETSIEVTPSEPPLDKNPKGNLAESVFNDATWKEFIFSGISSGVARNLDLPLPSTPGDPDYYQSEDYEPKLPRDPDYYQSEDYVPPVYADPDATEAKPARDEIKTAIPNLMPAKIYKAVEIATLPILKMNPEKVFKDAVTARFDSAEQTHEAAITTDRDFYDHSFEMPVPFSEKEVRNYNGLVRPLVASFKPEYNFLIKNYENTIKNTPEQLLPNMYVMETEMLEQTNNRDFQDLITLNNSIDIKFAPKKTKKDKGNEKSNNQQKSVSGQYFERYARQYKKIIEDKSIGNRLNSLKSKFSNIGIPIENMHILNQYDDKKFMYPMYLEAQFDTDRTTTVAEMLKDSKLSTSIMKRVMSNTALNIDVQNRNMYEITELLYRELTELGEVSTIRQQTYERANRRSWNITKLLKDLEDSQENNENISEEEKKIIKNTEYDIGAFLGKRTEELQASKLPQYKFLRALLKIIFTGKLKKVVKEKFRTLEELMSGKLAYSETILYRVEKRLASANGEPTGKTIQNFYFPNSNEIDIIKFADTQIKYGSKYVYSVYAYQAVIGTKYRYSNVKVKDKLATFMVTQTPSIELIEVPYYRFTGIVLDSPPVFPQIDIMQYKGIKDKALMWFNTNVGSYMFDPVSIEPEDEIKIRELRQSRGLDSDEKIRFRTDDYSGLFQIFRLEKHPKSYKDFAGHLIAAIRTDVNEKTPQEAPSAAFVDDLEPNKKYYYCFRCVDFHGNLSNPTDVYRVEIIEDSGAVYMLQEIVDFADEIEKMKSKPMKKYLYIKPTIEQSQVNRRANWNKKTAGDLFKNILLGRESQSVWGRRFKFRLISKNSGKKIDLNISFDVDKKLDTKEEKQ